MSTELNSLLGNIEIPKRDGSMSSDYKETRLNLTSFYGGKDRGKSLQIGFINEEGNYCHIQLDNGNVKKLLKELRDF